jgi:methylglyoxal synthase
MNKEILNIALIAHDGKKADMVSFVAKRLDFFNRHNVEIYATGTTGKFLKFAGIQKVHPMLSGPNGGDAQIGAMVAEGKIKAVLFFRDPLNPHPHEPDIQMLMRICDVHTVPLATNYMTAKYVIDWFSINTTP